ncbi:MAG: glycosyltransferase, partial [Candidatus Latescibacteria bacterium]|nr:glycosyltransferase [Candidatus Latescibacterota bacterium]
ILSSRYEGSPNVIKEALACNLPIVSTNVGDVQTHIQHLHNCQVCEGTAQSLATGLKDVLADEQPSDARDKSIHLSTDHIATQILQVYQQVLDQQVTP